MLHTYPTIELCGPLQVFSPLQVFGPLQVLVYNPDPRHFPYFRRPALLKYKQTKKKKKNLHQKPLALCSLEHNRTLSCRW